MSKPSPPSDDAGKSPSVDVGVAAAAPEAAEVGIGGVDDGVRRFRRDGVGVASDDAAANREDLGGGGGVAETERRRLRREALPGDDEKVFRMGLENESSGDEGPELDDIEIQAME